MFISQVHTHTLSLTLKILQTPRKMEIHQVHQSGTPTHTLFITQSKTDVTAVGDALYLSIRYTHT